MSKDIEVISGMEHNERIDALDSQCHHTAMEDYEAPLTASEIDEVKDRVTYLASTIQRLEEKKKELVAELAGELKPKKEEFANVVREARSGMRVENGKVWYMDDQILGIMTRVAEDGIELSSRPLKRDERDASVFKLQTGTE
jgi:uncharacterized small protein (DUF1192 family)